MFDTLAYAKKLTAAGVDPKQAEVHAEALAEIIDEQIATKRDLAELKADIIKWVAGMLVAQAVIIATFSAKYAAEMLHILSDESFF